MAELIKQSLQIEIKFVIDRHANKLVHLAPNSFAVAIESLDLNRHFAAMDSSL